MRNSCNGQITHAQWSAYVANLSLLERYPGINGIGVIESVEPGEESVSQYLAEMKQEREGFTMYPPHDRDILLPISYISPVEGNEKAIGLDVAHEQNRYQAAIQARNTGVAHITKAITLVQDDKKTPGFLFYAPYYQNNLRSTALERELNFQGMVYAPFIIEKLMNGILAQENRHVAIKITEGDIILYNEHANGSQHYDRNTTYKMTKSVDIYGQQWEFSIWGERTFDSAISNAQPYTILVCGLVIDGLLLFLFIVILRSNKRAVSYANKVTKKLEDEKNQLGNTNKTLEKTKQKLEKIAHHDTLTQLPNRYNFLNILEKALVHAENSDLSFAVCFIDLDNFKAVNDSLGHNVGDKLLQAVAKKVQFTLRNIDYLARLSGDEFGLIISNITTVAEITKIVAAYHKAFNRVYLVDGHSIAVSASIGIALYPTGGCSETELIKHADIAMYKAKELGKGKFKFFNEETNNQVQRRHLIETELQTAIDRQEFRLVYQPQIDSKSGKVYGVEALIRWNSAVLGHVGPDEFIPIAEESMLICDIGLWVLHQVGQDYSQLTKINRCINVSVNVSMRQIENKNFKKELVEILEKYHIKSHALTIEVTETALMKNSKKVINEMHKLSALGIKFALDDFGIGYSSMSYLKRLPISFIKIDQSFVKDIGKDSTSTAIVRTIISLSKTLGAKTTAEGVETQETSEFLKSNYCNYQQGYFFSKPVSVEELLNKLKS